MCTQGSAVPHPFPEAGGRGYNSDVNSYLLRGLSLQSLSNSGGQWGIEYSRNGAFCLPGREDFACHMGPVLR